MYICVCKGIKESDVENLGRPADLPEKTVGIDDEDNCCCLDNINDLVTIASREHKRHCTSVQL